MGRSHGTDRSNRLRRRPCASRPLLRPMQHAQNVGVQRICIRSSSVCRANFSRCERSHLRAQSSHRYLPRPNPCPLLEQTLVVVDKALHRFLYNLICAPSRLGGDPMQLISDVGREAYIHDPSLVRRHLRVVRLLALHFVPAVNQFAPLIKRQHAAQLHAHFEEHPARIRARRRHPVDNRLCRLRVHV